MFGKRCCVRGLLPFLAVGVAVSCTAVNTDYAPIDGAPYASITDPATGQILSDVAYAPIRNGIPYYLPRSLIQLAVTADKVKGTSITTQTFDIANPSQRYIAYYAANPFSEDALCIGRTTNGLLTQVYFSGNDRTGDVLLNVVQLAGTIASPAPPRPQIAAPLAPPTPNSVTMTIDPTNNQDVRSFEKRLGPGFRLSIDRPPIRQHPFVCPKDSICFATRITVPVKITYNGQLVAQSTVDVVDPTAYGSMDVSRAFMSVRVTKLDFDSGVLVGLRIRKDSEALAASAFPLQAIERLIAVPGNGIAVSFGTFAEKKQYIEDQQALTQAQVNAQATAPTGLVDVATCLPKLKDQAGQPPG